MFSHCGLETLLRGVNKTKTRQTRVVVSLDKVRWAVRSSIGKGIGQWKVEAPSREGHKCPREESEFLQPGGGSNRSRT